MHSSMETLCREIATAERPRNDSTIESFGVNRLVGATILSPAGGTMATPYIHRM